MRTLVLVSADQDTRAHLPFLDVDDVARFDSIPDLLARLGELRDDTGRDRTDLLIAFGPDVVAAAAGARNPRLQVPGRRIVLAADLPLEHWHRVVDLGAEAVILLPEGRDALLAILGDEDRPARAS